MAAGNPDAAPSICIAGGANTSSAIRCCPGKEHRRRSGRSRKRRKNARPRLLCWIYLSCGQESLSSFHVYCADKMQSPCDEVVDLIAEA